MAGVRGTKCLAMLLVLSISPSQYEFTNQEPPSPDRWRTIKLIGSNTQNNYSFGVSIQTENRVEIYGFSTKDGIETLSYHVDEEGRNIVDSGLGF